VYVSSSRQPGSGSAAALTYASSVASTGVLHGDAASAKVRPARYACPRGGPDSHELAGARVWLRQ